MGGVERGIAVSASIQICGTPIRVNQLKKEEMGGNKPNVITRYPASASSQSRSRATQHGVPMPCTKTTLRPVSAPHSYTRIVPYGVSTQRAPGYRSGGYGSRAISALLSCARSVRGDGAVVGPWGVGRRRRYSPVAAASVVPRTAWWKGHLRREAMVVAGWQGGGDVVGVGLWCRKG